MPDRDCSLGPTIRFHRFDATLLMLACWRLELAPRGQASHHGAVARPPRPPTWPWRQPSWRGGAAAYVAVARGAPKLHLSPPARLFPVHPPLPSSPRFPLCSFASFDSCRCLLAPLFHPHPLPPPPHPPFVLATPVNLLYALDTAGRAPLLFHPLSLESGSSRPAPPPSIQFNHVPKRAVSYVPMQLYSLVFRRDPVRMRDHRSAGLGSCCSFVLCAA